jgi:hypothetical protein
VAFSANLTKIYFAKVHQATIITTATAAEPSKAAQIYPTFT